MEPVYSMKEVAEKKWIAFDGGVYDIASFVDKHPGGKFLALLLGKEITPQLSNAHPKNSIMAKMLARFRVGAFDRSSLDPVDREFLELRNDLKNEGFFDYKLRWIILDVIRSAFLFSLGAALSRFSAAASFLVLTAASVDLVWWIHDAGHDAIFSSEKRAKIAIEIMGIFFLGMPQLFYHYLIHRVHHGFVNTLDADGALRTGPIVWNKKMKERSKPWITPYQNWIWIGLILPLTFPLITIPSLFFYVKRRKYVTLALLALRWYLAIHFVFQGNLLLALGPGFVTGFILGFMSSLNHFHLPIEETLENSFVRNVTERTQNIENAGPIWSWLSGRLNLHIEHHLFASMPSRNYPKVSPRIRAFCEKHGMAYKSCSKGSAIRHLYWKLKHPFEEVAPSFHEEREAG